STIPIVFTIGVDPIAQGLVASLRQPGANLTGVTQTVTILEEKQLQLLHELVPGVVSVGFLVNSQNPNSVAVGERIDAAAKSLGLRLLPLPAVSKDQIEPAFAIGREKAIGALLIHGDTFFREQTEYLVRMAAHYGIPTMFGHGNERDCHNLRRQRASPRTGAGLACRQGPWRGTHYRWRQLRRRKRAGARPGSCQGRGVRLASLHPRAPCCRDSDPGYERTRACVNKHRQVTPTVIRPNSLRMLTDPPRRWSPDRRRMGPRQFVSFARSVNGLMWWPGGVTCRC